MRTHRLGFEQVFLNLLHEVDDRKYVNVCQYLANLFSDNPNPVTLSEDEQILLNSLVSDVFQEVGNLSLEERSEFSARFKSKFPDGLPFKLNPL